ncbi:auxin response factor 17-like [Gastrolobium bilobum]|uniref:auxin response factor 17-like n=1 Tax=Gastrolobium bilobum TaxID=150636 RepID=UPI002AB10AB9|nr:auxin response factor 17-like [Gastrolobium bilobum]
MPPPQPRHLRQPNHRLDPKIWRACAGAAVQIPRVHSRVYYFPQGHVEHASHSPHYLSHVLRSPPFIPCRVSAVDFLADPVSDEVFAKILLTPIADLFNEPPEELGDSYGDKVVSFAKILTPSDANNGGGFSVPRFCADSIFPKLDFDADPPVQVLSVTDVHGVSWQFRHIYRGTPRRHLLTTGWSKYVNHKKLVAGDSVVFMKNSRGEMFAGIRRSLRFAGAGSSKVEDEQQKVVASAVESAAQKVPFEVVYYPKAGWSDFVVKAEVVEEAMKTLWCPGMRVKMSMETEDCSRMTWFQGTVSSVSAPDNGPWRMLQVNWDEPEVLQNAKRVSPWQVELVSFTPALHRTFPPTKKFRFAQGSGLLSDREGDPFFPMTVFPNSTIGHLNQTLLSYDTFPAGMQGARHDLFSASSFSNFLNDNSCLHMGTSSLGNDTVPRSRTVPTELNIGSSQSDELSPDRPDSQSSLHSFGTEFFGTHNSMTTKFGSGSILLFGKIIQPVQSGLRDADCMRDHGSKGCNETEGIDNPLDNSVTYSKLHSRLDVQCQRAPPVEASYF